MEALSHADLRAALRLVAALGDVENVEAFRAVALEQLRQLIGADAAAYSQIDTREGHAVVVVDPPEMLSRGSDEALARFGLQNPLIAHAAREPHTRALKVSDFVSQSAFQRCEVYQYVFRPSGLKYQMACGLPASPPQVFGFSLNRCTRDFTERDRALLDLLRPHLLQAHDRAAARERIPALLLKFERVRRHHGGDPLTSALTRREIQVVGLLARGDSNADIAAQLFLSLRTVDSHVSGALRKTGCANRTELAVLAVAEGVIEP
jgi:DNA-binding CsgD family transcriptional regulator